MSQSTVAGTHTEPGSHRHSRDEHYLGVLVRGTDAVVGSAILEFANGVPGGHPHRESMRAVLAAVSALVSPGSRWADAAHSVLPMIDALLTHLEAVQGGNGLFGGDNLSSPPDTSFTINDLCIVDEIIAVHKNEQLAPIAERLRGIAQRALPALLVGGVHTPNHRWELSSALSRIHSRWPDERIAPRVEQWLAEGVDVDNDGI